MSVQDTPTELWGGETTKAVANFPVSGERVPLPVVRWLGRIKGNAARVNAELGLLDQELADKIAAAGTFQSTLNAIAKISGTATTTATIAMSVGDTFRTPD